jgi:hypothetical protein
MPDGTRVITGSVDKTTRVWDPSTGDELLQIKGHTDAANAVNSVAAMPDGARIVTGSQDATSRLWDLAQLRAPPAQYKASTPEARQALTDQAKAIVPRCLTIQQRGEFLLGPKPPGWCIDMGKYPYNTANWKTWKARNTVDAADSTTADAYRNFADAALGSGNDFRIALEAAELGITFDPEQTWIALYRAHALMFLDRKQDARRAYLAHRGTILPQGLWEKVVVGDFQRFRKEGHQHQLMIEIEKLFKPSLPIEAGE